MDSAGVSVRYCLPILTYHRIRAPGEPKLFGPYNVPYVDQVYFEKQMTWIDRWGYRVAELDCLFEWLRTGKSIPPKTVVLTFDDGYLDLYVNAFPILKKYHFSATVFVNSTHVGQDGYLTWDHISQMEEAGIRFGNHGAEHAHLNWLSLTEAKTLIDAGRVVLEKQVKNPSRIFCYPFGLYTPELKAYLKEAGYQGALSTTVDGHSPYDDLFALRRLRISFSSQRSFVFRFMLSGYAIWCKHQQKKMKRFKTLLKRKKDVYDNTDMKFLNHGDPV